MELEGPEVAEMTEAGLRVLDLMLECHRGSIVVGGENGLRRLCREKMPAGFRRLKLFLWLDS